MNIQDALNSGKPFKRRDWETYFTADDNSVGACILRSLHTDGRREFLNVQDLLADDWELLENLPKIPPNMFLVTAVQAVNAVEVGAAGSTVYYRIIQNKLQEYHTLNMRILNPD